MNSRQRLQMVLSHKIPDCVPVAPDTSNMIPAKLTGKPFWELYLYQDPPIWKAYIDCVKYIGFDSLMDGYVQINLDENKDNIWEEMIVYQTDERIVTQKMNLVESTIHKKVWADTVSVYYIADPPTAAVDPKKIGLSEIPKTYKSISGIKKQPVGGELLSYAKNEMGNHGLVGVFAGSSLLVCNEKQIYDYYDNPNRYRELSEKKVKESVERVHKLMTLPEPPDFICTGGSGTLIWQTPQMFRELGLPIVKAVTKTCSEYGVPSHIHSCGPEAELVKICAEETDLTVIDPLEIPPMGDCNLAELKKKYGDKLVLKGNLHTTDLMLRGSTKDVIDACKKAIDDAAYNGGFILSTGDQCGRDTPLENLFAMVETARTYGKY